MISDSFIKELEEYASINNVPIMTKDGILFLLDYIKSNNIKNILEIGTAIGYSSIRMCSVADDINVTTIERDKVRYDEAIKNINISGLSDRINAIYGDALELEVDGSYDLIFIDAAKAQNIKFFEKYEKLLKKHGTIITDNMDFHGLVFKSNDEIPSRNLRQLVRKVNNYKEYLKNNEYYDTSYYSIGDGICISIKK